MKKVFAVMLVVLLACYVISCTTPTPETLVEVTSITLNFETKQIEAGESFTLQATVLPADATDKKVYFSSSNINRATVTTLGFVTGISNGKATITATCGTKSATCVVTIGTEIPDIPDEPVDEANRKYVISSYSTWFPPQSWSTVWGTPTLGTYNSYDEDIIEAHAEMFVEAGVDAIMIDCTNGIDYQNQYVHGEGIPSPSVGDGNHYYIEDVGMASVFIKYAEMRAEGKETPKVVVALGSLADQGGKANHTNGKLQAKVDWLYDNFLNVDVYQDLIMFYEEKPLVTCFVDCASTVTKESEVLKDDRVTLKYFSGFVANQSNLLVAGAHKATENVSQFLWSWWERGGDTAEGRENSYTLRQDEKVECITISAAWKSNSGWLNENSTPKTGTVGRQDGYTFKCQWDFVCDLNPQIVLINSFNEWISFRVGANDGEEANAEYSNDIEPSLEFGTKYMDILKEQIARYKAIPY